LGSGKQMISWIHVDDLCSIFEWAIDNQHVTGIYNAVAPNPVSNKTLMLTLARVLKGRAFLSFPVPAILLKLMLGEMSVEVLKSATASAKKLSDAGFQFNHEAIDGALKEIFTRKL